jgi:hypothetical protein
MIEPVKVTVTTSKPATPEVRESVDAKPADAVESSPPVEPQSQDADPGAVSPPARSAADRFSRAAKLEVRNRQREREIKAAEAELEARARQVLEREQLYAAAKDDPRQLEKIYGSDYYNRITEAQLNGGKLSAEQVAQQALEEARAIKEQVAKERSDWIAQQKRAAEQEFNASVDNYATGLLETVQGDPAKYRALNAAATQGVDLKQTLLQAQFEFFRRTGKAMSSSEALDMAETYYRDLGHRLSGDEATQSTKPGPAPRASQPGSSDQRRTLSNSLAGAPTVPQSPKPKSAIERALAAMEAAAAARNT